MIIGIDATGIFGPRTGIEHYIINIVNLLLRLDTRNKYTIYCRNKIPSEFEDQSKKAKFRILNFFNRKIFQQTRLPLMSFFDKIEVMFFPGNTFSLFCPCKFVLTVHDIFPYVISNYIPKYNNNESIALINSLYWKWMSKLGCLKSDKIISVSESTKDDIVRVFSTDPDKIVVAHLSARDAFHQVTNKAMLCAFKKRYGLPDHYILCVGTGTHKNIQGSIKAFQIFKKRSCSSIELIITGSKDRIREEILKLIGDSEFKDEIKLWGYFPGEDLNLLFNAAELLLFPSFYEGFGIPVLEAFSSGLPVLTSNVASLPEIAGDAAILVDPYNHNEIAVQLERILLYKGLRESLVLKGFKQARQFTWESGARKTLALLNMLATK